MVCITEDVADELQEVRSLTRIELMSGRLG